MKFSVAFMSHSVGVLSEGVHSFLDLVSAIISFFTVKEAIKPADQEHPFGHGKIETLSSLFEALLLVVAAALIVFEAIHQFQNPRPIQHEFWAMAVIIVSLVISYYVFQQNSQAAKATDSSALHVNALHFFSDVVTALGILIGLILMRWTGWVLIDPLIAVGVAGYIFVISIHQVKGALLELSDIQLPESELNKIQEILEQFRERAIEVHDLRTRKSGATRHIDFHLVICGHVTVEASHALCDEMESRIAGLFQQSSINIHVEPCEKERTQCHLNCRNAVKAK